MAAEHELETDYLVVGAGAVGMAFVDALIEDADVDVIVVDRRHRAGGHWLDSYPFVQLHQPSRNYGVTSTPLGRDRIEADGPDTGFYERASGTEICGYYDELMRHRLSGSGRVRFFPMCDYLGDRRFRSRLTGEATDVTVRRSVVDATYMASQVPATNPPPFEVADGARCIPVGGLANLEERPAGYVIIGGGKTALDAICWLLDRGTSSHDITWIRPRDSWVLNRAFFQPGPSALVTFEGVVQELEAIAECGSVEEIYDRLEEHEIMLRTDRTVQPTMMKGATISRGELAQLRQIDDVVRLGHVKRVGIDEIVLDRGSIPTSADRLHVHCASSGLSDNPPIAIFTDDVITLQLVTRVNLTMSAAMIGYVETTSRTTEEKNRLCPPNPWPHTPFDFLRVLVQGIETELAWQEAADLRNWVDTCRLNVMQGLEDLEDQAAVRDLQGRFLTAVFPAMANLKTLAGEATPAERARMFEPAA
jgi:hypothetical protein